MDGWDAFPEFGVRKWLGLVAVGRMGAREGGRWTRFQNAGHRVSGCIDALGGSGLEWCSSFRVGECLGKDGTLLGNFLKVWAHFSELLLCKRETVSAEGQNPLVN